MFGSSSTSKKRAEIEMKKIRCEKMEGFLCPLKPNEPQNFWQRQRGYFHIKYICFWKTVLCKKKQINKKHFRNNYDLFRATVQNEDLFKKHWIFFRSETVYNANKSLSRFVLISELWLPKPSFVVEILSLSELCLSVGHLYKIMYEKYRV